MRSNAHPSSRPRNRAGSIAILSVLNAVMATMLFAPTAAAQEAPPTPEEVLELLQQELVPEATPSPSEFFAAHPDETMRVIEFVRPDLDGDGIEDLIFVHDASQLGGPRVDVWSGWTLAPRYTIEEAGADGFGFIALGVPDLDGDGIDDLVVTAPVATTGVARAGSVFVYSGVDGAPLMRINGEREGGALGYSVAGAGDINGDGMNDLIVGEPSPDTGLPGRAFVFHGRPRAASAATLGMSDAAMALAGQFADDYFGFSVAGNDDATGDGVPDLLVGAPRSNHGAPASMARAGEALLYDGATGALVARALGAEADNHLGASIMVLPDATGDDRADIVVGAPGAILADAANQPVATPAAALVFGSEGWANGAATLSEQDALHRIVAQREGLVHFGTAVALGHDVNGDGVRDILISAFEPEEIIDRDEIMVEPDERAFTLVSETQVYSGADGAPLYHFRTDAGSGREIRVPYVAPLDEPQALFGDVDLNLAVESRDATLVMADIGTVDPTGDLTTDVNGDGVVDGWDAVNVLMYVDMPTALALAESMLGPDDCFDENGIPLPTCECLERHNLIVNPEDLDCDDGTDGGGDPDPGPGPGPGDNCDELPRDTEADCEAYAKCVAADEFAPQFTAIDAKILLNDIAIEAAEDAREAAEAAAAAAVADAAFASGQAQAAAIAEVRALRAQEIRVVVGDAKLVMGLD